jgi:hypothetical protein
MRPSWNTTGPTRDLTSTHAVLTFFRILVSYSILSRSVVIVDSRTACFFKSPW